MQEIFRIPFARRIQNERCTGPSLEVPDRLPKPSLEVPDRLPKEISFEVPDRLPKEISFGRRSGTSRLHRSYHETWSWVGSSSDSLVLVLSGARMTTPGARESEIIPPTSCHISFRRGSSIQFRLVPKLILIRYLNLPNLILMRNLNLILLLILNLKKNNTTS